MDSSISYDPELRVREVGARIVISSRAYELRQASTASFSDSSAFSQDSQASALLDGDKSSAAATVSSPAGATIQIRCGSMYYSDGVGICLLSSGELPIGISVSFIYSDGQKTVVADLSGYSSVSELQDGVIFVKKPDRSLEPTGFDIYISGSGAVISEILLSTTPEEGIVFEAGDISSLSIWEGADITGLTLSSRKLEVILPSVCAPRIKGSVFGSLVSAWISVNGSYYHAGDFYADSFSNEGSISRLKASDQVTRMARYETGLYVNSPVSLSLLLENPTGAVAGLSFMSNSYSLGALVQPRMLEGIDTQKRCVLKLAQAARLSSCWVDRKGRVNIISLVNRFLTEGSTASLTVTHNQITGIVSDSYTPAYTMARLYEKSTSSSALSASGVYRPGEYAQSLINDFTASSENKTISDNLLLGMNLRHRLKIETRFDPRLEIGDIIELERLEDRSRHESFIFVGQSIVLKDGRLSSVIELVGE